MVELEALCIKNFYMESGKIAYLSGKTYFFNFTDQLECFVVSRGDEISIARHYLPRDMFFEFFEIKNKAVEVLYA